MTYGQWRKKAFQVLNKSPHYAEDDIFWRMQLIRALGEGLLEAADPGEKRELSPEEEERLDAALERLSGGEPLPLIVGYAYFYGLKIHCFENVLIPRPDSELLVYEIMKQIKPLAAEKKELRLLDLCCGSGCLTAALLHECRINFPEHQITADATDISPEAVAAARFNLKELGLADRARVYTCDLWPPREADYDIVFSNPPYLTTEEWEQSDLGLYEPELALEAGPDGLDLIRRILKEGGERLRNGTLLFLEHGAGQGTALRELSASYPAWTYKGLYKDLGGRPRVSFLQVEEKAL